MKNILVLDDEIDVEFIFKVMLEDDISEEKLHIDFFSKPNECLKFMTGPDAKKYDYIFSDINMPQINGVQFASELRKSGYDGPIAFISAYIKDDYTKDMERLNISQFLGKPLNFPQIRDLLEL